LSERIGGAKWQASARNYYFSPPVGEFGTGVWQLLLVATAYELSEINPVMMLGFIRPIRRG
jgi:hypothetical protein